MQAFEVNFDGLVGPTHNYAGLSFGNVASMKHRAHSSRPREAALQGLQKMKFLSDEGFVQAVIPPQERPHFSMLRRLGFLGSEREVFQSAFEEAPDLAVKCFSASSMWTANAMTVAPRTDTLDGKTHFVPANLASKLHRSVETEQTARFLRQVFADSQFFAHHPPLPTLNFLGDEGAANHTRFCSEYSSSGLHLFVHGGSRLKPELPAPRKFPARQSLEASEAVAKLLRLRPEQVLFLQQNPEVIDAGVFHNDVISVGNRRVFFVHACAFVKQEESLSLLSERAKALGFAIEIVEVPEAKVSVADAVSSYLFNSQLLSHPKTDETFLLAPKECEENQAVKTYLEELCASTQSPIRRVEFRDLRESMKNGGGPACLRNRVVLSESELKRLEGRVILDEALFKELVSWVEKHYPEELDFDRLRDFSLVERGRQALSELSGILKLPSLYDFERL